MVVQHNLTAMNSNRMLGLTTKSQAKSTEKLSSGYKINRAADDAAGLAISEKMRKQIRGLTQASINAQDGISAVQTAEGALTEVHDMLQRMNELAVKSANGTNSEDDRSYIQAEIDQLVTEIDRVSTTTKFNELYLLNGDEAAGTKDVYSYKTVTTPSSATIADTVNLFDADGNAIADEDALKTILDADSNAKIFSNAGTEADEGSGNDYVKTTTYSIPAGTTLYDSTGATFDSTNTSAQIGGAGQLFSSDPTGAGMHPTGNSDTALTSLLDGSDQLLAGKDLWDEDGNKIAAGTVIDVSSAANARKYFLQDPGATKATEDNTYAIETGKKVYDESGAELDNAGVKAALDAGNKVYSTAPVLADKGTDYTYTPETEGKAQLYDGDGKAVAASDIAKIVEDGEKLYTDANQTDEATDLTQYTTKDTVNADLVFSLHVGADSTDDNKITVSIASISAAGIGVKGLDVSSEDAATAAIDTISEALKIVSQQRSDLGAIQNRLEHTINNLDNVVENTTSAESQIRDTDMATEMVRYSNNQILAQAGQAMLAQANQSNQGVLSLLG